MIVYVPLALFLIAWTATMVWARRTILRSEERTRAAVARRQHDEQEAIREAATAVEMVYADLDRAQARAASGRHHLAPTPREHRS